MEVINANRISLCTRSTGAREVFNVYWRTGLSRKGVVRVSVTAPGLDDRERVVAAELSALRHLLEDRNVCGHNKAGKGLEVFVSLGAIRKLLLAIAGSAALAPYAQFLRTRFLGAKVNVENRDLDWADAACEQDEESLVVDAPVHATIEVGGFGRVELTPHALERYTERFALSPTNAWRRLQEHARDAVRVPDIRKGAKTIAKHWQKGEFAIARNGQLLLVVTPAPKAGMWPRLVTIYRPTPDIEPTCRAALSSAAREA
jgi:hypothetical protein